MSDTPTTFEATLSNKGKLSATKKSSLQHSSDAQYFRLFLGINTTAKALPGAPLDSLLQQSEIDGQVNVLILKNYSVLITVKELARKTTRNYFFSYGGGKRTSLKRRGSY